MNQLKKLAGQTLIYGLSSIIGRLLNYLLVPFYTRVFLPHEYGIVTEIYAYMALFFVILTYGMETALFNFSRNAPDPKKVYSTALISIVLSSSAFVLLMLLGGQYIAGWLDYGNHPEYIYLFSIIVALDAVTAIPFARLRQENRPVVFATIKLVNISANIIFNVYFLLLCPWLLKHHPESAFTHILTSIYDPGFGVTYVFISNLLSSALTLLMLFPWLKDIRWKIDPSLWRLMIRYALPLAVMGLAGVVNESFDRILLKHLLPDGRQATATLGIYGACAKIAVLMTLFTQTFRYAWEPFFFAEAKKENAREIFARVATYFVILGTLVFLGTMLFIDVVKYFIGEKFHEGLSVVPILLLAYLFLGLFYNLSLWYKLTDNTRYGAYIAVGGSCLSIVLYFILIPLLGYVGAAWTHFTCYFTMMAVSWYYGQKYYPVPYQIGRVALYVLAAVVVYLLHAHLPWPSVQMKLAWGIVFLLAYSIPVLLAEYRNLKTFRL